MHIIILRSTTGLNNDGWGIELGREQTTSYFFGLFKKTIIVWSLWRKYSTRTNMLNALEQYKQTSKYQFRPVKINYK